MSTPLNLSCISTLAAVSAAEWNALCDDYPFTRHEFLYALERHGCADHDNGWQALHLLARGADGALLGAAPLYLKYHSWGEFVFDFSWAQASQQAGLPYYPKLVNAVPFVPSTGPRLLSPEPWIRCALADGMRTLADEHRLSSVHSLFVDQASAVATTEAGMSARTDVQFHWFNHGFADFSAFCATLSADKRKKMLRERRRVTEQGIHFVHRSADTLSPADWVQVNRLYANTYEERGQPPYLNLDFFEDYGGSPGSPMRLIMGYQQQRLVCVAITLIGGDTLYGRHWGAAEQFHSLHFECCYYQGIELCIREGLRRYDAGTQGEHKLARGFVPQLTHSRHYIRNLRLRRAVDEYLIVERQQQAQRQHELLARVPFRETDTLAEPTPMEQQTPPSPLKPS